MGGGCFFPILLEGVLGAYVSGWAPPVKGMGRHPVGAMQELSALSTVGDVVRTVTCLASHNL